MTDYLDIKGLFWCHKVVCGVYKMYSSEVYSRERSRTFGDYTIFIDLFNLYLIKKNSNIYPRSLRTIYTSM